MRTLQRLAIGALGLVCLGILAVALYFLCDLYAFEYPYAFALIGPVGTAFAAFIVGSAGLWAWRSWRTVSAGRPFWPHPIRGAMALLALWIASLIWIADWTVFGEAPFTEPLTRTLSTEALIDRVPAADTLADVSGVSPARPEEFRIALARIIANRPAHYSADQLLQSVPRYARQYDVEPVLLYFWLYLGSFYGEAPAGRVPFLKSMTAETIRDFVQAHLPSAFIESTWRRAAVESAWAGGSFLGHPAEKWRYAIQKATYDVSVEPFDTNIYTDVFLVLKEYQHEFAELSDRPGSALDAVLADAFKLLNERFMPIPYSSWTSEEVWDDHLYRELRRPLKRFARAVLYKMIFDLDFGSKVQALVGRHYLDRFEQDLGANLWARVSPQQRLALLVLLRDAYEPNIGNPSANLYNLPEFNLAPYVYLSAEAGRAAETLTGADVWVPADADERLWGATSKLRVFSEFWQVWYGDPLPGVPPASTLEAARTLVDAATVNSHREP